MTTRAANAETTYLNTYHAPAANADAVCTIDANPNQTWVLDWIAWSYDIALVAAETLVVTINAATVFTLDIPIEAVDTVQPPQFIHFPNGLYKPGKNQALVVTLSAGGAGCSGSLNIGYH